MNDLWDDFYMEQDFKLWFHVLRDIHSKEKPFSVLAKCLIQILRLILYSGTSYINELWFYKISIVNVL